MPDSFLDRLDQISGKKKSSGKPQPASLPVSIAPLQAGAMLAKKVGLPAGAAASRSKGPEATATPSLLRTLAAAKSGPLAGNAMPAKPKPVDAHTSAQDALLGPIFPEKPAGLKRVAHPAHLPGPRVSPPKPNDGQYQEIGPWPKGEQALRDKKAQLETEIRKYNSESYDVAPLYKQLAGITKQLNAVNAKKHYGINPVHDPSKPVTGQYPEEDKEAASVTSQAPDRTNFDVHSPDLKFEQEAGSLPGMLSGLLTDRLGTSLMGAEPGWWTRDPENRQGRATQDMITNLASMVLPGGVGHVAQAFDLASHPQALNPTEAGIEPEERFMRALNDIALGHGASALGREAGGLERAVQEKPERSDTGSPSVTPQVFNERAKPEGLSGTMHRSFEDAMGHKPTKDTLRTQDIGIEPGMQYKKVGVRDLENQVTDEYKGVTKYDHATAGPLTVWRKKDGSYKVMNGHHRLEIAKRTGEPDLDAYTYHESDGVDFTRARAIGALQNLRDGKGTAIDAATVLRDLKAGPKQLQDWGLNMRGGLARDAQSLLKLSPESLKLVEEGRVPESVASGIADAGLDEKRQLAALKDAARGELSSRKQGETLGMLAKNRPVIDRTDGQGNLLGEFDETTALAEQAKISEAVVRRLAGNERLYKALNRGKTAGATTVDVDAQTEAARVQDFAKQVLGTDPEASRTLEEEAVKYASKPNAGSFNKAIDAVERVALDRGERRLGELGGRKPDDAGGLGQDSGVGAPAGADHGTAAEGSEGSSGGVHPAGGSNGPPSDGVAPGRDSGELPGSAGESGFDSDSQDGLFAAVGAAPHVAPRAKAPTGATPLIKGAPPEDLLSRREGGAFKAIDEVSRLFSPQSRSEAAGKSADLIREKGGIHAHFQAQLRDRGKALWKSLAAMPEADRWAAYSAVEKAAGVGDSPLVTQLREFGRSALDPGRDAIQAETGRLQSFYDDYLPHLFEDVDKAKGAVKSFLSRRPLQGNKAFLRSRTHAGTLEEILAENPHLKPKFDNPVDMIVAQAVEQNKFLEGARLMKKLPAAGIEPLYVRAGAKAPEFFKPVPDSLFTKYGSGEVKIHEAYDQGLRSSIEKIVGDLGGTHERKLGLGHSAAWGFAKGDKIDTRFGGGTEFLTHELGHLIDSKLGLGKFLFGGADGGEIRAEAHNLAGFRYEGQPVDDRFKAYVHEESELPPALVHAYVHAPDLLQQETPKLAAKFEKFIDAHPQLKPLREVHGGLAMAQGETTVRAPGIHTLGQYYLPQEVADVFENYLGPGLSGKSIYQAWAKANNGLNMVQLALPTFHMTGSAANAMVTETAAGLRDLGAGVKALSPAGVLKGAGRVIKGVTPYSVGEYVRLGEKIRNQYLGQIDDPKLRKIVEGVVSGGGRVEQDARFTNQAVENFGKAWQDKKVLGVVGRAPGAAIEKLASPVMKALVPRLKLGAFGKMFEQELDLASKGGARTLSPEETRRIAAKAWDSVDNRFGQVVYDNLMMNRTMLDLAHASTRSVGWNMGTWREFGGAAADLVKRRELSQRVAYAAALPVVVGTYGSLMNVLMTGEWPTSPRDMFFPRTGKKNPDGTDERLTLPTYLKDIYGFVHSPAHTVTSKLGPLISTLSDMLGNKDYYGAEIRHEDDSKLDQGKQMLEYAAGDLTPFALANQKKEIDQTGSPNLASLVGINRAPSYLEKSPALQLAEQFYSDTMPRGSRTRAEAEKSQRKSTLVSLLRNKRPNDAAARAAGDTELLDNAEESASSPRILQVVSKLPADKALQVFESATKYEKGLLRSVVLTKIDNADGGEKFSPEQVARMRKRLALAG